MRRFHMDNSSRQLANDAKHLPFYDAFKNLLPDSQDQPAGVSLGSKYTLSTLSGDYVAILRKLYAKLYPDFSDNLCNGSINISSTFRKYGYIIKDSRHINSMLRQRAMNTYVLASPVFACTSSRLTEFEGTLRPVKLLHFMEHSLILPGMEKPKSHIIICKCSMADGASYAFCYGKTC